MATTVVAIAGVAGMTTAMAVAATTVRVTAAQGTVLSGTVVSETVIPGTRVPEAEAGEASSPTMAPPATAAPPAAAAPEDPVPPYAAAAATSSMPPGADSTLPPSVLPFHFFHAGHFQRMLRTGDVGGQVELARLPTGPGFWGLGALAGMAGELVQLDGRVLVSPGSNPEGAVRAPLPGEQALLFAAARVTEWVEVPVPRALDRPGLSQFIAGAARARELSMKDPFVFRVIGKFPVLKWHVLAGATTKSHPAQEGGVEGRSGPMGAGGGPGHEGAGGGARGGGAHEAVAQAATAHGATTAFEERNVTGQLVGVYSGLELEGVVTHPGERLHVHYVDAEARRSGHADDYGVAAGAVLLLPSPASR